MSSRKIRAFVDTTVLLEYIRGKAELQSLFSDEVRERVAFTINAIVLQELLLVRGRTDGKLDLTRVIPYLEVAGAEANVPLADLVAELRLLRDRAVHVNDIFILTGARSCDVLLTYNREQLDAAQPASVRP